VQVAVATTTNDRTGGDGNRTEGASRQRVVIIMVT
jgi:hypothetical protein